MKIDKYTTYSCEELEDAMVSVNSDGTFEVYGFDANNLSFEDLRKHKQFLDYVFDVHSPSVFKDLPWDDPPVDLVSKTEIPTYPPNTNGGPTFPTKETMFG